MADKKAKETKQPQQQGSKKKGSYALYASTGRRDSNKRAHTMREERLQAFNATQRPRRTYLRKLGAVNRLQRRLDAATAPRERERLAHSLSLAVAAGEVAYAAYEKAVA